MIFIYFSIRSFYLYILLLFFSLFNIDNKKILIVSFEWKGYWDMGKYICNELTKYNYKIYRAAKDEYKQNIPEKINYVKYNSIGYLFHLATSKIWINNSRFLLGTRKRKEQFYIQTWHWCFALKKVESAINVIPTTYLEKLLSVYSEKRAKNDSKMANLFISNSIFCTNFYRNYFRYNGDILEYWCPRNDIIIKNDKSSIKKVKDFFWISDSEKICMYAPTFRDNAPLKTYLNIYNIEYKKLINELETKFKGNWKILIRLHPIISNFANKLFEYNRNIINVTDYSDMQELLLATDFLITDYSSCIFDYALSWKPAMIYASDIEEYKKDRDFEIKLEKTPFPIATNNIGLKKIISSYDINEYKENLNKFYNEMWLKETGKSCQKITEIINRITKYKKNK